MSISGWSRRDARGAAVGIGPPGGIGPTGPTGPTGPSGITQLLAASGWWYYASPPADLNVRYFGYAAQVYVDNGPALGLGAQVANDGILQCRKTGRYWISCSFSNNGGGGSYLGGRFVLNGAARMGQTGGMCAVTMTDGNTLYGMGPGASAMQLLNAGDYIRIEACSSTGYGMYIFATMFEWPY